jgi:hypothetical protein
VVNVQTFAPTLFRVLDDADRVAFEESAERAFSEAEDTVTFSSVHHPAFRLHLAKLCLKRAEDELHLLGMNP